MRLRHRPDRFIWRENSISYHRLQDGPTLSRLDPYCAGEQAWLLHCGRIINVTAAEVRSIAKQVNDQDLPDTRPTGDWDEARIQAIEERLAALEASSNLVERESVEPKPVPDDSDLVQFLRARIAELEARGPEAPPAVDPLGEELEKAREANRKLVNGDAKQPIPKEIVALLDEGETFTHDVRRKLTERLNVELAELKNLRGLAGEDLKREAEIEKLLGLFARLGEI